jgi:hypothetical protein
MKKKIEIFAIISTIMLMATIVSIPGKEVSLEPNTQNYIDLQLKVEPSYDLEFSITGGKGITFKVKVPEGYDGPIPGGEIRWSGLISRWGPFKEEDPIERDIGSFTIKPGYPMECTHTFNPQLNGFGTVHTSLYTLDKDNNMHVLVVKRGLAFRGFVILFY